MIACASPFGWIAGWLSEQNRSLPFVLNFVLYTICAIVLYKSRPMDGIDAERETVHALHNENTE